MGAAATAMIIIAYLGSEERSKITETASVVSSPKNEVKEGGDSFVMLDKAIAEVDSALKSGFKKEPMRFSPNARQRKLGHDDSDSVFLRRLTNQLPRKSWPAKQTEVKVLNEPLPLLSERGQPMPIAAKTSAHPSPRPNEAFSQWSLQRAEQSLKAFLLTLDGDSLEAEVDPFVD